MTESLAAFQAGLGRALMGEDTCPIDPHSAGFRFTTSVRRSWCEGRTLAAARPILRVIPESERRRLVGEYVDQGGGLALFLAGEREAFLTFLAARLPDPSHALTLCCMSQALAKARLGASMFVPPRQRVGSGPVGRGRHAALVQFHADPDALMMALKGGKLPPIGPPYHALLFAPGLPNLFRTATQAEVALWADLPSADAPPALIARLFSEGALAYVDRLDM
jgi:hypothetical protein